MSGNEIIGSIGGPGSTIGGVTQPSTNNPLDSIAGSIFGDVAQPIIAAITAALQAFWDAANSLFGSVFSGIGSALGGLYNAFNGFVTWLGGIVRDITGFFQTVFGDVISAVTGFFSSVGKWFDSLVGWFEGLWQNFTSAVRTFVGDVINFFTGIFNWIVNAIHNFANDAVNAVTGFLFDYIINPFIGFLEHTLTNFIGRMNLLVTYWLFVPQLFNAPQMFRDEMSRPSKVPILSANGKLIGTTDGEPDMAKGIVRGIGKMVGGFFVSYFAGSLSQAFIQSLGNPSPQLPRPAKASITVNQTVPINANPGGSSGIPTPTGTASIRTSVSASLNRLATFSAGFGTDVRTQIGNTLSIYRRPKSGDNY